MDPFGMLLDSLKEQDLTQEEKEDIMTATNVAYKLVRARKARASEQEGVKQETQTSAK